MATKNTALRNALAEAFGDLWNDGVLEIRDNTDTVLVSFSLDATDAFGAAATGKVSATGTPIEATAAATGTADNAVLKSSGGTYELSGLTVGTSGANVIIDNTSIENGQTVNLNQFDWTEIAGIG